MANDSFCIQLGQYDSKIKTSWQQFQFDKNFCDVTLACDGNQIEAHKIVISSGSLVLRNALKSVSSQHPHIYITGVKYKHLQNLIQYMYQGQVKVPEEDLDNFLHVAEDLKVRGLSDESGSDLYLHTQSHNISNQSDVPTKTYDKDKSTNDTNTLLEFDLKDEHQKEEEYEKINGKPEKSEDNENIVLLDTDPVNIKSEIDIAKENIFIDNTNPPKNAFVKKRKMLTCKLCDQQIAKSIMKIHKELVHNGNKYPCDQCGVFLSSDPRSIRRHKESIHKNIKYSCDECDTKPYADPGGLLRHKKSVHLGVRYQCEQCGLSYTDLGSLRQHEESVHNGLRYHCDQCGVSPFTQLSHLRRHKKTAHKEVNL